MSIWRGITLSIWGTLLAASVAFLVLYQAFSSSILDAATAKRELKQSGVYENLRDTVLADRLSTVLEQRYPSLNLVGDQTVRDALREAFPDQELPRRFDPAIDQTYRWLNGQDERLDFEIPTGDRTQILYQTLERQLRDTVGTLPTCDGVPYPPETALLEDRCLPSYVTAGEAVQAAMGSLRAGGPLLGETISSEQLISRDAEQSLAGLPRLLATLNVLQWLVLAVSILSALFLIAWLRATGLLVVGLALFTGGTAAWLLGQTTSITGFTGAPLVTELLDALRSRFIHQNTLYSAGTATTGAALVITSIFIIRRRRGPDKV